MGVVWWTGGGLAALAALYIAWSVYLAVVLKWEDERTAGLSYYGLPPAEREAFKRRLRLHARLLSPVLWLNGRLVTLDFRKIRIVHKGVSAPAGTCSAESFERAEAYQPRPEDIFVVTQMKCGTTWMEHVVYEVLNRGSGNLVESGITLYSVAPWLEGRRSVPVDHAPLHGSERPSRIIKTHLPAQLCPVSGEARYIYVARHPVSCFASCMDFVATNVGAMAPGMAAYEEWFCSRDLMWWGTWPDHVRGWWERAAAAPNVLYMFFEDMKRDLPAAVRQVAEFLKVKPLSETELARAVEKCGFSYMQRHQVNFEMHPPHVLETNAALFVSGTADRHNDVPEDVRRRIVSWCAAELKGSGFPPPPAYSDIL